MSPVKAGDLRDCVIFQKSTDVDDGSLGFTTTFADTGDELFAKVSRRHFPLGFDSQHNESGIEYFVSVRGAPTVDALKMRIRFGTRILRIISEKPDVRGELTEFRCIEVPADQ